MLLSKATKTRRLEIRLKRRRGLEVLLMFEELAVLLDQAHYLSMMSQTVATVNSDSSNTTHTSTISPIPLSTSTNVQATCTQPTPLTTGANAILVVSQPCVNPDTLTPAQTPLAPTSANVLLAPIPLNAYASNAMDLNAALAVIAANAGSKTQAINYSQASLILKSHIHPRHQPDIHSELGPSNQL